MGRIAAETVRVWMHVNESICLYPMPICYHSHAVLMALSGRACVCTRTCGGIYVELMHMHAPGTRYASRHVRFFTPPCNLMHNVSALCHASLVCLCPWCSGGTQWNTVSVYHNACRLTVARQDDWRRMRGRYNPVCGTSRLDLMSPGPFDIQRSPSAPGHLPPLALSTQITVTGIHNTGWHLSDWLTSCLNPADTNRIGRHPMTRVGLGDIVFVLQRFRRWLVDILPRPIGAILFGFSLCLRCVSGRSRQMTDER